MAVSEPGGKRHANDVSREASADRGGSTHGRRILVMLERIGLGVATIVLSFNLWTGFPLLALWIGSQSTGGELLNLVGVAVTVLSLIGLSIVGLTALARISARYDRVTNRPPPVRQPPPWLLSMSASSVQPERGRREINAIEMIVITAVVSAFALFEIWFFFLASTRF